MGGCNFSSGPRDGRKEGPRGRKGSVTALALRERGTRISPLTVHAVPCEKNRKEQKKSGRSGRMCSRPCSNTDTCVCSGGGEGPQSATAAHPRPGLSRPDVYPGSIHGDTTELLIVPQIDSLSLAWNKKRSVLISGGFLLLFSIYPSSLDADGRTKGVRTGLELFSVGENKHVGSGTRCAGSESDVRVQPVLPLEKLTPPQTSPVRSESAPSLAETETEILAIPCRIRPDVPAQ